MSGSVDDIGVGFCKHCKAFIYFIEQQLKLMGKKYKRMLIFEILVAPSVACMLALALYDREWILVVLHSALLLFIANTFVKTLAALKKIKEVIARLPVGPEDGVS